MNLHRSLDWDRLIDYATEFAKTEPGFLKIESLEEDSAWAQTPDAARILQTETQEMMALLDREALWGPLFELASPDEILETLTKGGILTVENLSHLRAWLYAIDSWAMTPRESIQGELFKKALSSLMDPREPIKVLDKILTPEGTLSERASQKLFQLYTEIRSIRKDIGVLMDRVLHRYTQSGVLQESFSDVHDGRYVIPVRISSQNEVDGNVYGTSGSKQTVFIEPAEVAPLNNKLKRLENDLGIEIQEILERTSKILKPFSSEIESSVAILAHWDAAQAKARLARVYGGRTLVIGDGSLIRLRQTANPLLWWSIAPEAIQRNDIEFGDPVKTLLLTGPNTGGKTVLLKTLGLAGICARTGFAFPGTEQQTIPFFDSFYVDIGDTQSIEHHLSSFSGHIARFKTILENMTERSLVLLDELNTATDPGEGAALGRAFLETVMSQGAIVVATTHDPQLKALALNDSRILNASMAFNERSRTPTFTIVLGVPGRSRALETAERLGLPRSIIELARSYLSDEHNRFESMLAILEKDAEETDAARREANRLRDEAERLKREWTERTEKNVTELLDRTKHRLRAILEQAQDQVRAQVKKLDEAKSRKDFDSSRGDISATFTEANQRIESALREEAPDVAETLLQVKGDEVQEKKGFSVGETVRVPKWKNMGQIIGIDGTKFKVKMGSMQVTLGVSDLEKASNSEKKLIEESRARMSKPAGGIHDADRPSAPGPSIDLRGERFEVAMQKFEAYIDQAFRSRAYAEITIVHGLGTGAIREGTRKILSELPYVKSVRDGGAGGGGAGATIVEFDH